MIELYSIRCPGKCYKWNFETQKKELVDCNALLCKASKGSTVETVCPRCKSKITAIVRPTLDDNPIIDLRQEFDN